MSSPNREEAIGNVASGSGTSRQSGATPPEVARVPTVLSREEEAYQEAILEIFHADLIEQVAKEFPDDERRANLAVQNTMAQARRRIPKRVVAEGLYWSLKAKLGRFVNSVSAVLCETVDGELTPDGQAKADLFLQKWDKDLGPKLDDVKARLDGSYYGYNKLDDDLLAKLDQDQDEVFHILGPLRRVSKTTSPPKTAAPAATPAPAAPATPAVVTARAFVVKDYVPVPFTGEGKPQDILGGFRSWEAEWEDARKNLDKCPGVTAPIRLTMLQLALGGAALKLVKAIPAGTDDGYDLAMKKLRETYHNPVGLATALLNASETEKRPRIHQETDAHIKSLRAAMLEEEVELETFYFLHPILQRLSTKDAASWAKWTVSQRTRFNTEQQRLAAADRKVWRVGMAYNLESFSNWREETVSDAGETEDVGVNLAGARYQPEPSGSGRGGCAIHGWTATHRSADCNVLRGMNSETWLRTAKAVNACVQCGEWYRRGHTCPRMVCEECGKSGHATFRCRRREEDRRAVGRTPSTAAPFSSGPSRDRRRLPEAAPAAPSAAKRARSNPRDRRARSVPRPQGAGPASASQPPALSPGDRSGHQRGGKGKKSPGGKTKTPAKE